MHVDRYHFASLLPAFGIPESRGQGARVGKSQDSLNREQRRAGEHYGSRQEPKQEEEGEGAQLQEESQRPRSDRMLDITV